MATQAVQTAIIPPVIEEIDEYEHEVRRFRDGGWEPDQFMAWRLLRGVYGQRQPDAQMFRIKIPYGGLNADQIDALGIIARDHAPLKKGHFTTRENMQFHHMSLEGAAESMRVLAEVGLTTREACGNTVRNVVGCPMAGVCPDEPFDMTPYAAAYARYFVRHPVTQKMPRKIKSAFSGCENDCAITAIHDVGFLPAKKNGQWGLKMVMGGGLSIMPRIAPTLYEFLPFDEYLKVSEAALRVFDKSAELRKNRMKARVKFLIDRIGIDEFRKLVEEELKGEWAQKSYDPTPLMGIPEEELDAPNPAVFKNGDASHDSKDPEYQEWLRTSVTTQRQAGYNTVLIKIPIGDVWHHQFPKLADITRDYAGSRARVTQGQNLMLRWVPDSALHRVWEDLKDVGFGESGVDEISDVTSCPGTDSCKLGITSSMGLGWELRRTLLEEVDTSDPLVRGMHIKMSGCPNSCGQHHIANIGFHGGSMKGPGGQQVPSYEMFVGGGYENGDARIGQRLKGKVPAKRAPAMLKEVIQFYKDTRVDNEAFNTFVDRVGVGPLQEITAKHSQLVELNRDTIDLYMDWERTTLYKVERGEGECAV